MNPLAWDAPKLVVHAALFCIVFIRAGATYAAGRGLIAGMSHTRWAARAQGERHQRAMQLVAGYGAPVVALCFLTVGLQTLILLSAGGLRMPLNRFLPALVVGSAMWSLLYGTVGFVGFELWMMLYEFSPLLAIGGTVVTVATLVGLALRHRIRTREATAAAELLASDESMTK